MSEDSYTMGLYRGDLNPAEAFEQHRVPVGEREPAVEVKPIAAADDFAAIAERLAQIEREERSPVAEFVIRTEALSAHECFAVPAARIINIGRYDLTIRGDKIEACHEREPEERTDHAASRAQYVRHLVEVNTRHALWNGEIEQTAVFMGSAIAAMVSQSQARDGTLDKAAADYVASNPEIWD